MRNLFLSVLGSALLMSCSAEPTFRINGVINDDSCHGAYIFLVPFEGPRTSATVDSVIVDGRSFVFEGTDEQMRYIILGYKRRLGHQQLMVVTEPGVIDVVIDSVSSASGTPQNDALQQWKETLEACNRGMFAERANMRAVGTPADSLACLQRIDSLQAMLGNCTFDVIKRHSGSTVSKFVYKISRSSLTPAQRAEADSLCR